jgi:16S rRNA (cytosine1402-N4)-methyltransferase
MEIALSTPAHVPVLSVEVLDFLACRPGGCYVDCTVGQAELDALILERIGPDGQLIGIDQDPEAITVATQRLSPFQHRVHLFQGNFSRLQEFLSTLSITAVDGIVFDLGISSAQLGAPSRGFSFQVDGPLDMRMDSMQSRTAAHLANELSEHELMVLISTYGEERFARRIARAIVTRRRQTPIETTAQLVDVVRSAVPSVYRHGRIHCATRTFQAFRIAVNQELDVLEPALRAAIGLLKPEGRICVIAFHSLEDRIVKQTFRAHATGENPSLRLLTKKPVEASDEECRRNPRARSAKLRAAERRPLERCV